MEVDLSVDKSHGYGPKKSSGRKEINLAEDCRNSGGGQQSPGTVTDEPKLINCLTTCNNNQRYEPLSGFWDKGE